MMALSNGANARPGLETTVEEPNDGGRFGAWINLAGRQRMLSQRIGLLLLLAAEPGPAQLDHRAALAAALDDFAAAHRALVDGDAPRDLPKLATPRVLATWADGSPSARTRVEAFVREARQFVDDLAAGRAISVLRRETFVAETCSDVLAIMNRVTQAVEGDFADLTRERAELRRTSAERVVGAAREIATAARYARQVSFNAKISAVRAGPYGREFSALTEELKTIADQIGASSQSIIAHIDEAG